MPKRKYERTHDGDTWKEIDESAVREVLAGCYVDVGLVMDAMHEGQEIRSVFAVYREKKEEQHA